MKTCHRSMSVTRCAAFQLFSALVPFSATCLPTSPCGGTVSPSWRLHSSVCPTCIFMNWGTCGRSSSTWQWGASWPCRSDWGSRSEKRQTTTSDKNSKQNTKGPLDLQLDVSHVPWKSSTSGLWQISVWTDACSCMELPGLILGAVCSSTSLFD